MRNETNENKMRKEQISKSFTSFHLQKQQAKRGTGSVPI